MESVRYRTIGVGDLDAVRPLWEKLNSLHSSVSAGFSDRFRGYSFSQRKQELLDCAREGSLRVLMARDSNVDEDIGYCISTLDNAANGEIQSLFLDDSYRGHGIGHALMNQSLEWLVEEGAKEIVVSIIVGNQSAISFYTRYGFVPHSTQMLLKKESTI